MPMLLLARPAFPKIGEGQVMATMPSLSWNTDVFRRDRGTRRRDGESGARANMIVRGRDD